MVSMDRVIDVLTSELSVEVIGDFCRRSGYEMVRDLVIEGADNVDRLGEVDLLSYGEFHQSLGDVLDREIGSGAYESLLDAGLLGKVADRVRDGFYEDLTIRYEGSSWDWAEVGDYVRIVDYRHYSMPEGVVSGEVCRVEEDYSGDVLVKTSSGNVVMIPWENYVVVDRTFVNKV